MKNHSARILNYHMIIIYSLALIIFAAFIELLFIELKIAAAPGLVNAGISLAETGFSVTVIAVSILTVITNMSEKRYFGIKAGEYLKFRRKRFSPGFYDMLVIIVIVGALQYAAIALEAAFAAAVIFLEIIALMIIQIRWGLSIAFFYYGKEKEIRAFFINELSEKLKIVAAQNINQRQKERASLAVDSRIDNLFSHTKHAAAVRESSEIVQNLGMLTYILKTLLDSQFQSVWHSFEIRLDHLLSSLIADEEQREYALSALDNMMDIIIETINSDTAENKIAEICDFDTSRNKAYSLASYAEPKILKPMFEKQLFYKMAVVKVYGIKSEERKVSRYAHYTNEFAKSISESKYLDEIKEMLTDSIAKLAPLCFYEGRIQPVGYYVCIVLESLEKNGITLPELQSRLKQAILDDKQKSKQDGATVESCDTEKSMKNSDSDKQKSVYMIMKIEQKALGIKQLRGIPIYEEQEKKTIISFAKLLGKKIEM